jgi:hypothetical protein
MRSIPCVVLVVLGLAALGSVAYFFFTKDTYEVERTDYQPPTHDPLDVLTDDRLEDKTPPPFDPTLTDRRELNGWLVNSSAAILQLDVPMIKRDQEPNLLVLRPSYAAVMGENPEARDFLPSVNMVDGKAKQFDDGLYAALDQAYYQGLKDKLLSHVALIRRMHAAIGKDGPAAAYLGAGLELAGVHVEVSDQQAKDRLLKEFRDAEVMSKPIGFYTWNDTLTACFRFMRFFQQEFAADEVEVALALARVLAQDKGLLAEYQKAVAFYAKLTNPYICLSLADLSAPNPPPLPRLAQEKNVSHATVAVFPPSRSRETLLFEKLFPMGLPPNADLIRELILRIRSGEVNLRPGQDSGWYDYQVYALETLLLPEKGDERNKLVQTKAYKKRMLEAFQALITKRRETHVRTVKTTAMGLMPGGAPPPESVRPRLRVEPCPSYFLRTARAYAFLANFLESSLGKEGLQGLHGLKKDGVRKQNLYEELHKLADLKRPDRLEQNLYNELHFMRDLFYGIYLVSAEDIGLKPALAGDEPVDRDYCYKLADNWLRRAYQDKDLAVDTRVSVPIYVDPTRGVTLLWATLGVRLSKLDAKYATLPQIKTVKGGEWKPVEQEKARPANYLIPVDESAEIELKGMRVLTREELREVCDREQTKELILQALQK